MIPEQKTKNINGVSGHEPVNVTLYRVEDNQGEDEIWYEP